MKILSVPFEFGLYFTWFDFVITPLWAFIIFFCGIIYARSLESPLKKIFIFGLSLRIIISFVQSVMANLGLVSRDDYAGLGKIFAQKFYNNPLDYFRILLTSYNESTASSADISHRMLNNETTLIVCKIGSFFDIFTYHTYSATTLLLSMIPFVCCWMFFNFLTKKYGNPVLFAIPLLYAPSLILWSSAYMKDTITYATLVMMLFVIFSFKVVPAKRLRNIILFVIAAYLTIVIKSYIFVIVVVSFLVLKSYNLLLKPVGPKFKKFVFPFYLLLAFGLIFGIFALAGRISPAYSIEALIQGMKGLQTWITVSSREGGAIYELGDYDSSLLGLLSIMPSAINVCLFRPYLWESNNIVMLITSIEGILLMFVVLWAIFRVGLRSIYKEILNDKLIFFLLLFSILFLFVVGFSTYNFGSLARYKIPGQLTFYIVVAILFAKNINKRKKAKENILQV